MTDIRSATEADIPVIARLHVEGWKGAYGGVVDQNYLDSLTVEKRTSDWANWIKDGESQIFIAETNGAAAGFVVTGRTKTPPPGSSPIRPSHSGEIYALYLLPEYWRLGIGTAMLKHGFRTLKERKHSAVCLWVLDANQRAKAFYEKNSGQKIGNKMIEIGPSRLKEVCYGWRDTSVILK